MKKIIFKVAVATLLSVVSFSSVKAQMYYQDSHLFVGQKPTNHTNVGPDPQVFIGPEFGIEFFDGGLNFWRPNPVSNWGNYKLFLDASGRFGIGRKPANYALEVNGQIWTSVNLLITSDGSLKRNITSISESRTTKYTDNIYKLDGKIYEKQISSPEGNADEVARMVKLGKLSPKDASVALDDLNKNNPTVYIKEFGFIAQEVKELFPELVEESGDGLMAINYIGLIPLLVESLKELNKKVADLEKRTSDMPNTRFLDATDNTSISLPGAVLYQNTPNPFSDRTEIQFALPENTVNASIYIFNMQGTLLKQYPINSQQSYLAINGFELNAGMYLYSLIVDGKVADTKRMILTK